MFNVIIAVFLVLTGLLGFNSSYQEIQVTGIVFMCLGLVWFISSTIQGFMLYSEQVRRFENLRASIKQLAQHREMTKDLLKEFKLYLVEKFPELEMKFFQNFKDSESDMRVILAYPEFKTHKTITQMVDKINNLTKETYTQLYRIENDCASIRYNKASKWQLFQPKVPEVIQELL